MLNIAVNNLLQKCIIKIPESTLTNSKMKDELNRKYYQVRIMKYFE